MKILSKILLFFPLVVAVGLLLASVFTIVQGNFNSMYFAGALLAAGFFIYMRGQHKFSQRFNRNDGIRSIYDDHSENNNLR